MKQEKIVVAKSTQETRGVAARYAAALRGGDVVCLQGDLGSGKTTFAQGILVALGAQMPHSSPTFTIVRTYVIQETANLPTGQAGNKQRANDITTIRHVDPYRVSQEDVRRIGWEEMIADPHALMIIEWPERIIELIPSHAHFVTCTFVDDTTHMITFPS